MRSDNCMISSISAEINNIAASLQEAIVDVLVSKTVRAAKKLGMQNISIAGGVSANSRLREKMIEEAKQKKVRAFFPNLSYCLDNAAMIGFLASNRINEQHGDYKKLDFTVNSRPWRSRKK